VALHVEDKLTLAADTRLRKLWFERRLRFDFEKTAALGRRSIRSVERQQRSRSTAR